MGKCLCKCIFLCVEVMSGYDSGGAFTSVIVLVQIVAALCFLWWGPDVPARMRKQRKWAEEVIFMTKVRSIFRVIVRNLC